MTKGSMIFRGILSFHKITFLKKQAPYIFLSFAFCSLFLLVIRIRKNLIWIMAMICACDILVYTSFRLEQMLVSCYYKWRYLISSSLKHSFILIKLMSWNWIIRSCAIWSPAKSSSSVSITEMLIHIGNWLIACI